MLGLGRAGCKEEVLIVKGLAEVTGQVIRFYDLSLSLISVWLMLSPVTKQDMSGHTFMGYVQSLGYPIHDLVYL